MMTEQPGQTDHSSPSTLLTSSPVEQIDSQTSHNVTAPSSPQNASSTAEVTPPNEANSDCSSNTEVSTAAISTWISNLSDPALRDKALITLGKKRELIPDLAVMLWYSFGSVAALLEEVVSVYPSIIPPTLSAQQSNRVCNALALLQCIASHPDTRNDFMQAKVPFFLYPFLHTSCKTRPFEYLRLTSLGVIGALVKTDEGEVIAYLINTEIVPLCLRIMEHGSELSKTVATFILQKVLADESGLQYICHTYERFSHVAMILGRMILTLSKEPSARLLKHIVRCYLRLSENDRARKALQSCLPDSLRNNTFAQCLANESQTKRWLQQLLQNLDEGNQISVTLGQLTSANYGIVENHHQAHPYPPQSHIIQPNTSSLLSAQAVPHINSITNNHSLNGLQQHNNNLYDGPFSSSAGCGYGLQASCNISMTTVPTDAYGTPIINPSQPVYNNMALMSSSQNVQLLAPFQSNHHHQHSNGQLIDRSSFDQDVTAQSAVPIVYYSDTRLSSEASTDSITSHGFTINSANDASGEISDSTSSRSFLTTDSSGDSNLIADATNAVPTVDNADLS